MVAGDGRAATSTLAEAAELGGRLGERALEGWACFCLGLTETLAGEIELGRSHLERGRALHRDLGVRIGEARATAALGLTYVIENDQVRGRELVEEALAVNVTGDDDLGRGSEAHRGRRGRARLRRAEIAPARAGRPECARGRGRSPGRRGPLQQRDRGAASPVRADGGKSCAPRAGEGGTGEPNAACDMGGRADSVANPRLH